MDFFLADVDSLGIQEINRPRRIRQSDKFDKRLGRE